MHQSHQSVVESQFKYTLDNTYICSPFQVPHPHTFTHIPSVERLSCKNAIDPGRGLCGGFAMLHSDLITCSECYCTVHWSSERREKVEWMQRTRERAPEVFLLSMQILSYGAIKLRWWCGVKVAVMLCLTVVIVLMSVDKRSLWGGCVVIRDKWFFSVFSVVTLSFAVKNKVNSLYVEACLSENT